MKVFYEWLKRGSHSFLRRIELVTREDLVKKPEIPQISKMAQAHQKFIDARRKSKSWKKS